MKPFFFTDFSLKDLTLLGEYQVNALEKEINYLLSFDLDRLLAGFRETAGLDKKGKERYGGWESLLIGGHTLGHYLTACAQAYSSANTGNEEKEGLAKNLTYLVQELRACQLAQGTGLIFGAIILDPSNVEQQFDMVEQGKTEIFKESWVPYYTLHKLFCGLVSIAYLEQELGETAKLAKVIASDLADWVYNRGSKWSEQTHKTVLSIEYGGVNDCLYDVYLLTGKEEHLKAAQLFDEVELFERIYQAKPGDDALNNMHANTNIPKFQGALKRYLVTGEERFLEYVKHFFWLVANCHSYITGDNSEWEHFGKDNILDGERTNCNCETCNAYNMLKICKLLYMITGDTVYADWYENTYLNSIMSSQNPETGMTTYFQPMASGYFKTFSTPFDSFWCCTGSGMESFTKLPESYYFHTENALVVNQYLSSKVEWREKGMALVQKTRFPMENTASFTVEGRFQGEMWFRIPKWLKGELQIRLDGKQADYETRVIGEGRGYAVLAGDFEQDTLIELTLSAGITPKNLPDGQHTYGFLYGPYVLCGLVGRDHMEEGKTGVDVTIAKEKAFGKAIFKDKEEVITVKEASVEQFMDHIDSHMTPVKREGGLYFKLQDTDADLEYTLHYSQYQSRFGLYFQFQ